jgi:hypothetical protein
MEQLPERGYGDPTTSTLSGVTRRFSVDGYSVIAAERSFTGTSATAMTEYHQ